MNSLPEKRTRQLLIGKTVSYVQNRGKTGAKTEAKTRGKNREMRVVRIRMVIESNHSYIMIVCVYADLRAAFRPGTGKNGGCKTGTGA